MDTPKTKYKAVGLISGGLDSALAVALLQEQGMEIHAVYIEMPWGCGKGTRVKTVAEHLGVPLKIIPLGNDYLQLLRSPKFGFGSAFNPCIDCHVYMIRKAAEYMQEIGAELVFTGEVQGQRPMSQRHQSLLWVEKEAGIPGRLLRPLSAAFFEPTIPEQRGIIDRSKFPAITGRSRKMQYELAERLGVKHFAQPGGGCLLTEKHFGVRIRDFIKHGCEDINATAVLGLGRYFRLDERTFIIVGRDERENGKLAQYALPGDILLRADNFPGPVALLRGREDAACLALAAGLVQYHSKWRDKPSRQITWWHKQGAASADCRSVEAVPLDEAQVKAISL